MIAVYGNLMIMGIAAALLYATVSMGRREPLPPKAEPKGPAPSQDPRPYPTVRMSLDASAPPS